MDNQPTTTRPATYIIKTVEIQDTPILSLYLQWSEDDGEYNCDVPLSWAYKVTHVHHNRDITNLLYPLYALLIDAIKADDEFSQRICRLEIDDNEPIPAVFLPAETLAA